jgi:hypothetical protein
MTSAAVARVRTLIVARNRGSVARHACSTIEDNGASQRVARPVAALISSSATGMPSERAASTAGSDVNPPSPSSTSQRLARNCLARAASRRERQQRQARERRRAPALRLERERDALELHRCERLGEPAHRALLDGASGLEPQHAVEPLARSDRARARSDPAGCGRPVPPPASATRSGAPRVRTCVPAAPGWARSPSGALVSSSANACITL